MSPLMIWLLSSFMVIAFFIYLLRKIIENYENMIEREKYERYKNERFKTKVS
jgi:large-conductance mechanosensitive channel